MNKWITIFLIASLLVGFGIATISTVSVQAEQPKKSERIECSSCNQDCSPERNCGLSSCGALQGKTCGCKG